MGQIYFSFTALKKSMEQGIDYAQDGAYCIAKYPHPDVQRGHNRQVEAWAITGASRLVDEVEWIVGLRIELRGRSRTKSELENKAAPFLGRRSNINNQNKCSGWCDSDCIPVLVRNGYEQWRHTNRAICRPRVERQRSLYFERCL